MRPSLHLRRKASLIVTELMAALQQNEAAASVDASIDAVLERFRVRETDPLTARGCHQNLGRLVRAIVVVLCEPRVRWPGNASCRALALELIQLGYQGAAGRGYESAIQDAIASPDPLFPEGIDGVLIQLASILKAQLRDAMIRAVFARYLDPCDPELNLAIAQEIQHRYRRVLTPECLQKPAFELAVQVPDILQVVAEVLQKRDHLLSAAFDQ